MLTIGKLAESAGVGVETIRFYQRKELLEIPPKTGAVRRYGKEDLRRLHFIRQAKAAGFRLEEIKELLDLDATQDRARARGLAKSRLRALDAKIDELQHARDALQRVANECAEGSSGPCPILSSFGL